MVMPVRLPLPYQLLLELPAITVRPSDVTFTRTVQTFRAAPVGLFLFRPPTVAPRRPRRFRAAAGLSRDDIFSGLCRFGQAKLRSKPNLNYERKRRKIALSTDL